MGKELSSGSSLSAEESLSNGDFQLRFQKDGNLVVYMNKKYPVWSSGFGGRSGHATKLKMEENGNLAMYERDSILPYWTSETDDNPGAYLILEESGVATIYKKDKHVLWTSNVLPNHGATMYASNNHSILSDNKEFELTFQTDGNLVLYKRILNYLKHCTARQPIWASQTITSQKAATLRMEPHGDLVLRGKDDNILWVSGTSSPGARLRVQNDGSFSVFANQTEGGGLLWSSLGETWMSRLPDGAKVCTFVCQF